MKTHEKLYKLFADIDTTANSAELSTEPLDTWDFPWLETTEPFYYRGYKTRVVYDTGETEKTVFAIVAEQYTEKRVAVVNGRRNSHNKNIAEMFENDIADNVVYFAPETVEIVENGDTDNIYRAKTGNVADYMIISLAWPISYLISD